jgi:hypothetical protein
VLPHSRADSGCVRLLGHFLSPERPRVCNDAQQVAFTLHQAGLEASLPQGAAAPVPEVEGLHVGLTDPAHRK